MMLDSSSTCLFSGLCAALVAVALAYYFYW